MKINFSIIMPTYNRAFCIEKAIDSLLNQSYPNYELIIIDDGSTDATEQLIKTKYSKELENKKILYKKLTQNKGVCNARNIGLKLAQYDWIGYLDSDNEMLPDFLEEYRKAISNNTNKKIFYSQIQHSNGRVIGKPFNYEQLLKANYIDLGVLVHHKSLIKKCGKFDTKLKRLVDWDLIIRYTKKETPHFIEKILLKYSGKNNYPRITNTESLELAKKIIYNKQQKFISKIFSVKNCDFHKKITILGIQIKVKTRKLQEKEKERERERNIQANFDKLNNHIKKLENKLIAQAVAQNEAKKDFEYKLCKYMPEEKYPEYLKDWFYIRTGNILNIENPQTFNEKIQWLKLYDKNPLKSRLADKYLVRDWVKEKIGEEYLIPLIGVWEKFEDIDFDKLPDKFVLKANHGSGWNIIVTDKQKFDKEDAKQKFDEWLHTNFAFKAGLELHYKDIKPLIIAEKYIENDNQDLYDYKIWCFDGKAKYIQFLSERKEGLKMVFYDTEWNKQDFVYSYPRNEKDIEKPKNLELLLTLAEKLAQGFSHVRVDFYILNDGSIKFGEMTFTSMSGVCKWVPNDTNKVMGDLIAINKE